MGSTTGDVPAWAAHLAGTDFDQKDVLRALLASASSKSNSKSDSQNNNGDDDDPAALAAALEAAIAQNPSSLTALLDSLPAPATSTTTAPPPPPQTPQTAPPGMTPITPHPWHVLKTRLKTTCADWPAGLKVFVNLCRSPDVPPPPIVAPKDVWAAIGNDASDSGGGGGYKVPLSLSGPRSDRDKEGRVCLVFEACVNDAPARLADEDDDYRFFLQQLCLEFLEEKHGVELDRNYTTPKMKAKGPLSTHYIPPTTSSPNPPQRKSQSSSSSA
ncbi:pre-RNA processing PIH1/Nop17-domain-containing protein [Zopfochytrium polystomum]|nr:pre-RNA processing PIH1/Nop17-domain-containing protein [Zopfochytrium polystomum]